MQLAFRFDTEPALEKNAQRITLALPNILIEGEQQEVWPFSPGAMAYEQVNGVHVWRDTDRLLLIGLAEIGAKDIDVITRDIYAEMLNQSSARYIHRFWNFVPSINQPFETEDDDLEQHLDQYMAFSRGRALAYQQVIPEQSSSPAASAVGTTGNKLLVICLAGSAEPTGIENPLQTPAYEYPQRYGPNPPRFARAATVTQDTPTLFVSGTASIRKSESLHHGDLSAQASLAMDNIAAVTSAAGHDSAFTADGCTAAQRGVRVYVRHPEDWAALAPIIAPRMLHKGVPYSVVQADICRPELLVEIEAYARWPE